MKLKLFKRIYDFFNNTCCHCGKGKVKKVNTVIIFGSKLHIYKCNVCGITGV